MALVLVITLGCAGGKGAPAGSPSTVPDLGVRLDPSEFGVPAMAAAVLDREGVLAVAARGQRRIDRPETVEDDDRWHLGSDTKAMTALVAATVVDAGGWTWETPVASLFPGITVHPGWQGATLGHLLHHRSGMGTHVEHPDWWAEMWRATDPVAQRAAFAEAVFGAPPDHPLGDYAYSNFGYIAVGAALERHTGQPWEAVVAERVFTPLGMSGCGFGAPTGDEPWGHAGTVGAYVPKDPASPGSDNPPTLGPAGTVHCPAADWGRFGSETLRGARGEGTLASDAAYTWLHTPPAGGDYAGGWGVRSSPELGGAYLAHDGSNTMWYARMVVAVDADRVYLAAVNAADPAAVSAVNAVIDRLAAAR